MKNKELKKLLKTESKQFFPDEKVKAETKRLVFGDSEKTSRSESSSKQKNRRTWGYAMSGVLACCVVVAMVVSLLFTIPLPAKAVSETLITIDINPSVELVADKNNVVTAVRPMNKDAVLLLYNIDLVGHTVEDASKRIVELAVKMEYLNASNSNVTISSINDNDDKVKLVNGVISQSLNSLLQTLSFDAKLNFALENVSLIDARLMGESPSRTALIKAVQMIQPELSNAEAKKLSNQQLNEILKKYNKKQIEEAKTVVGDLANESYLAVKEQIDAIENMIEKIEDKVETAVEEVVKKIEEVQENSSDLMLVSLKGVVEIFNKAFPDLKFEGEVSFDNLDNMIEFFEDTIEEKIENILEKYEEQIDALEDHFAELKKGLKKDFDDKLSEMEDD